MNKKHLLFVFAALIAVLFTSCTKDEEILTGSIVGLVTDYTNANQPIAGATVTLSTKGISKTTGSDGRYEFTELDAGSYSIQVQANGFQPTTKQATVYAGQIVNCDFQLSKGNSDVNISPVSLAFGKNVETLSFTIENKTNAALNYSVSNVPSFVEVVPAQGTVAAKGRQAVSVNVIDHSKQRTGQLTVNIGSDSYTVSISVTNNANTDPGSDDDNNGDDDNNPTTGDIVVTRSLLAYYNFDKGNANNAYRNSNNGNPIGNPKYITDTPSKTGKALSLESGQYIDITNNMLNGKTAYTISMWVKDFGTGTLFGTYNSSAERYETPSLIIDANCKMYFKYGCYISSGYIFDFTFSYPLQSFQSSGWHMITVTASNSSGLLNLYIDGKKLDTTTSTNNVVSVGNKMMIGSYNTDPMYIDNVRIYSTVLSESEIQELYKNKQ